MTDERLKQLMEQVVMPNSISLYGALQQAENEGFQAGAASRDAEVYTKQWAIEMLNHWNDELLAQIKQKDAEIAELVRFIKEVAVSTSDHTTTDVIDEALAKVRKP